MKKINKYLVLWGITFLLPLFSFAQDTIYVKAGIEESGIGQSWETAYKYLQDALSDADSGDEIWVAAGTYYPDRSNANPNGTGSEYATFEVTTDIKLYGGFEGTEQYLYQRVLSENTETIISGIGNNLTNELVNSYYEIDLTIDGFKFINAEIGISSSTKNILIQNCNFTDFIGGSVIILSGTNNNINHCRFFNNHLVDPYGDMFAGVISIIDVDETPILIDNCEFTGNTIASPVGGAITFFGALKKNSKKSNSSFLIRNSTFIGNISQEKGGAISNFSGANSPITIENCYFENNQSEKGGAIFTLGLRIDISNSIFYYNNADYGGAFCSYPFNANYLENEYINITNCTFIENYCNINGNTVALLRGLKE